MEFMDTEDRAPSRVRIGQLFDKAEAVYLRVLRITILVIATLLIVYTSYLAASGLYLYVQSPLGERGDRNGSRK